MKKEFILGCSGWFYRHWHGPFYPKELKQSRWFSFYAQKFNSVELNSTFYRFPSVKTAKGWYKKAPENFIYTLKANRLITHQKKFKNSRRLVNDFYKAAKALEEKLGCVLWQLPSNLHKNMEKLDEITSQLKSEFENSLEFRHESWWDEEVFDRLKENNIAFCTVSAPGLPDTFKNTAEIAYFRFHGKKWYQGSYSKKELAEWAKKMKKAKAKKVYAYFNNDFNAFAPKNCLQLMEILKVKVLHD